MVQSNFTWKIPKWMVWKYSCCQQLIGLFNGIRLFLKKINNVQNIYNPKLSFGIKNYET